MSAGAGEWEGVYRRVRGWPVRSRDDEPCGLVAGLVVNADDGSAYLRLTGSRGGRFVPWELVAIGRGEIRLACPFARLASAPALTAPPASLEEHHAVRTHFGLAPDPIAPRAEPAPRRRPAAIGRLLGERIAEWRFERSQRRRPARRRRPGIAASVEEWRFERSERRARRPPRRGLRRRLADLREEWSWRLRGRP